MSQFKSNRQVIQAPEKSKIGALPQYPSIKGNENYDHGYIKERYKALEYEFRLIDRDNNGQLSRQEIQNFMKKKCKNSTNEQIVIEVFNELNLNSDDYISKDEFAHGYLQQENSIRQQILQLEKDIYNEQQHEKKYSSQLEQIKKLENATSVNLLQIKVLSGIFETHYKNIPVQQKSKINLIVALRSDDIVYNSQEYITNPSLNCTYPLWGDNFDLILMNKQLCTIQLQVKENNQNVIGSTSIVKQLINDFESNEQVHFKDLGDIQIQLNYVKKYQNLLQSQLMQSKQTINGKFEQCAQLKVKLEYYKQLFGSKKVEYQQDGSIMIKKTQPIQHEQIQAQKIEEESQQEHQVEWNSKYVQCDQENQNDMQIEFKVQEKEKEQEQELLFAFSLPVQNEQDKENDKIRKVLLGFLLFFVIITNLTRSDYLGLMLTLLQLNYLEQKYSKVQIKFLNQGYCFSIILDVSWLLFYSNCGFYECDPKYTTWYFWGTQFLGSLVKIGFIIYINN